MVIYKFFDDMTKKVGAMGSKRRKSVDQCELFDDKELSKEDESLAPKSLSPKNAVSAPKKSNKSSAEPALKDAPSFLELLKKPTVHDVLPDKFDEVVEAEHLTNLWLAIPQLRKYCYHEFVSAGGSGMVFKVSNHENPRTNLAMKIARNYFFANRTDEDAAFSPVEANELKALKTLKHQNIVYLEDAIEYPAGSVVAIVTSYIDNPSSLDSYLERVFSLTDKQIKSGLRILEPFSPERLDNACVFLIQRFIEVSSALSHMHNLGIFHFDIKPANILIGSDKKAMITDLGSCILTDDVEGRETVRVNFTWTYAHPDLQSLRSHPGHLTGGLKVAADVDTRKSLAKFDLFALGRTMQRALAILYREFGERCYSTYGFRYLHIIAGLLLDGFNAPSSDPNLPTHDGISFIDDCARGYSTQLFSQYRIKSADDLVDRLKRYSTEYFWLSDCPELGPSNSKVINTGFGDPAPLSYRVIKILDHPAVKRLKSELQLGWMKEVYPGATHNRWSHTIGVYSNMLDYYSMLLTDPDVPILRILVNGNDISHALLAALLHDIGQADFAHDIETGTTFRHETIVPQLLDDDYWGPTLRSTIEETWRGIDLNRVLAILGLKDNDSERSALDGLAKDIIDGPVDADKFDYIGRDSVACGVSYGLGIDRPRFLQSLSIVAKQPNTEGPTLSLAYRAKGAAAIESLLLARYQMYGAVYWHHTYRCIQAMFVHAFAATFSSGAYGDDLVSGFLYNRVICRKPLQTCLDILGEENIPSRAKEQLPPLVEADPALEMVWRFGDSKNRRLIESLASRELYKRVFEMRLGDIPNRFEYSGIRAELSPNNRPELAEKLETSLLNSVLRAMQDRGNAKFTMTKTDEKAMQRYDELVNADRPLVVIDFPIRGIPNEDNYPSEIMDSARKYIAGYGSRKTSRESVFESIRQMQISSACIRVFVTPKLHELITRYLDPNMILAAVSETLTFCKSRG